MTVKTDSRVDHYIMESEPFAQPILNHLRNLVHIACPDVIETIKWSFPNFDYKGSPLCHMASFKKHCAFGFWLGTKIKDTHGLFITEGPEKAMGQLGQITSVKQLPPDEILIEYILQACSLIEQGVKLSKTPAQKKPIDIPDYVQKALNADKKARSHFDGFTPAQQREYLVWITEAKTEATRLKRLDTMLEWVAQGKKMNWKYEK
jgi:uncharacterized protein YdeI (YjbR/CyaY-like superfamily)